ncbi:MAG: cysteine desulfurase [Myxococcales bacterium]|nr:cysteine desulfurase [Myxococcales bacterium]
MAGGGMNMAAIEALDIQGVREQFPILRKQVGDKPLVYLDTAASAQKPQAVIDALHTYYTSEHANVHRGVHHLSALATQRYEAAREQAAAFLHAPSPREVVFVRGTSEAVNLVASSWGQQLQPGDEIVVSAIEHHSNIVPWQLLAQRTGAVLRVAPVRDDASFDLDAFEALLGPRTRLVSVVHVSNAFGTVLPVKRIVELAHAAGALVMLDGAQATVHGPVDVAALGCDFYAFSGHKVYGPTGIGVLWGREALLDRMPPYQGGGEMISSVSFEGSTWAELPAKFEAGTPHIAGAVGLGVALRWLMDLGRETVAASEASVLAHGTQRLSEVDGLRLVGTAPDKQGVLSFVMEGIHPQDLATLLDEQGIAVRTGHHCAEPGMRRFGIDGTVRASIGVYTTTGDLDALVDGLQRAARLLR